MSGKHHSGAARIESRPQMRGNVAPFGRISKAAAATIVTGGTNVALICGTMLELVRRDGRDLTARQLTTLLTVYLEDTVHSVSSIANMLQISRPGVTRILDRLVEADLVSRAEDSADRRRVLVYRTRSGAHFVQDLIGLADSVAARLSRSGLV